MMTSRRAAIVLALARGGRRAGARRCASSTTRARAVDARRAGAAHRHASPRTRPSCCSRPARGDARRRRGRTPRLAAGGARAARASATRTRSTSSASSRSQPDLVVDVAVHVAGAGRAACARAASPVFMTDAATIDGDRRRHRAAGRARRHDAERRGAAAARCARGSRARRPRRAGARRCACSTRSGTRRCTRSAAAHLISQAIALCGGENVFAALTLPAPGRQRRGGAGGAPEVIVAGTDGGGAPALARRLAALAGAAGGARRGNSASSTPICCTGPGPRFVDGVEQLCAAMAGRAAGCAECGNPRLPRRASARQEASASRRSRARRPARWPKSADSVVAR